MAEPKKDQPKPSPRWHDESAQLDKDLETLRDVGRVIKAGARGIVEDFRRAREDR